MLVQYGLRCLSTCSTHASHAGAAGVWWRGRVGGEGRVGRSAWRWRMDDRRRKDESQANGGVAGSSQCWRVEMCNRLCA